MAGEILITKTKQQARKPKPPQPTLVGKTVVFSPEDRDHPIAGVVKSQSGSVLEVAYAIPNSQGILITSKEATTFVLASDAKQIDAVTVTGCDVREWRSRESITEQKSHTEVKGENGEVIDYRGVTFEGFASTYGSLEDTDRDNEYIMEGAYNESIKRFKENPVMLTDHTRSVTNLMGKYDRISMQEKGLAMRGVVTDDPGDEARHVRFAIVEKALKTLSVGGAFFYAEDYRGIKEVDLFETSLVVVPSNHNAQFQVRSIDTDFAQKAFNHHADSYDGHVRFKA